MMEGFSEPDQTIPVLAQGDMEIDTAENSMSMGKPH